ncbi:hypothetical protein BJA01nite_19660 [Bradyrhizobium japonicum]|nr:hypothetical protein BJ6T_45550 [Bradyrhizobium japonicum USDA 6]GEC44324.1 hypothetical protein BJA01nite_19660 [Bradyrhizobium japonicum]
MTVSRAAPPFGACTGAPPCWITASNRSGQARLDCREYGPAPGSPQACNGLADMVEAVPIPGPAIQTKVSQSGPI